MLLLLTHKTTWRAIMSECPFHISIRPFHIKRQGICGIRIQNQRTIATTFTLSGQAEDEYVQFEAMPAQITIPQGQKGAVCIRVKRKRPLLGLRRKINFTIQVQSSGGTQQALPGLLEHFPYLALWQFALLVLFIASILLV